MSAVVLALVAAATAPSIDTRRTLAQGLDLALDYCAATASNGTATLDGRIMIFDHAPMQALPGLKTTADAPGTIRRFAATARPAVLGGHREIVAIEAGDGIVWLVMSSSKQVCDMAITAVDDPAAIPPAITAAVLGNANWTAMGERKADAVAAMSFALADTSGAQAPPLARLAATVLPGTAATGHVIQAELNFSASGTAPPAQTTK